MGGIGSISGRPSVTDGEDDHTDEERHELDTGIAESLNEYEQGLGLGPVGTHKEFIDSLHNEAKKPGGGTGPKSKHPLK